MDVDRQRRAQRIFEVALELPADERSALVARECAGDEETRRAVLALLAADASAPDLLPRPPEGEGEPPPDVIPGYRLLGVIGYGGISTVYLAEPLETPGSRVAIKVLRPNLPAALFTRRFAAEQRILSFLAHPFIVPVLGAGTAADERPYLVMPEVLGEPITDHCDHRQLALERRIEIFLAVCDAVAAAHQDLVVHRDLKPSNVLITDEGEPRLLDFGIAKVLDDPGDPTATENRIFTRNYASPEHLAGRPVTTASDVYSLGVLLHQLLCGRRPYEWGERSPADIVRELGATGPVRPSAAIAGGAAGEAVAEARRATPAGLLRQLRGDLDTIVAKALMSNPRHRYRTVDAFAEDLRRHLAGMPIEARPATPRYRLEKFVRRHALESALAAVALGLVISLALVAVLQAVWARRERDAAVAARRQAEQVTEVFLKSFDLASSPRARGGVVAAREIIDQGAARAGELSAYPELQAALRHALGVAYDRLGLYEEASRAFDQALAARRERLGSEDPATTETLLASVSPLRSLGRFGEAEPRAREALEARRRAQGSSHPATASAAAELASTLFGAGQVAAAQALVEKALPAHRAANGVDQIAGDLDLLARIHIELGRPALAEEALREALALLSRTYGEAHRSVSEVRHSLGGTLMEQGRLDEAAALFRGAMALDEQALGREHPQVARDHKGLGLVLRRQGKYDDALAHYATALAIERQAFGDDHASVASTLGNIGAALLAKGSVAEAEERFRQAVDINRRVLPANHIELARALNNLGNVVQRKGAWTEAENLQREALAIARESLGSRNLDVALGLDNVAWLVWTRGARDEAEAMYREALEIRRAVLGNTHHECAQSLTALAWLRREAGDLAEAETLAREALAVRQSGLGASNPQTAYSRVQLAAVLAAAGRGEEARQEAEQAIGAYREALPNHHWRVGMAHVVHGLARATTGDSGGVAEAEDGLARVRAAWPPDALPTADAAALLALARRRLAAH